VPRTIRGPVRAPLVPVITRRTVDAAGATEFVIGVTVGTLIVRRHRCLRAACTARRSTASGAGPPSASCSVKVVSIIASRALAVVGSLALDPTSRAGRPGALETDVLNTAFVCQEITVVASYTLVLRRTQILRETIFALISAALLAIKLLALAQGQDEPIVALHAMLVFFAKEWSHASLAQILVFVARERYAFVVNEIISSIARSTLIMICHVRQRDAGLALVSIAGLTDEHWRHCHRGLNLLVASPVISAATTSPIAPSHFSCPTSTSRAHI